VHGTASAAQGAPGSASCRKVNQVNASQSSRVCYLVLKDRAHFGSLTHWMLKNGFLQDDNLSRFAQPASLGL